MTNPLVSIIIANYNGQFYLSRCLPTLFAQDYPAFEVIIIDNGSTDDSLSWLQRHYPQVTIKPQADNVGFCVANNLGIRASQGQYIILLNNDTTVAPGFISALIDAATSQPEVGMVASQIVFDHTPHRLDSAGIEVDYAGVAWNRHLGQPVVNEPTAFVELFGPSGAAGLYKRAMLDQIGLFDEDYFMYYEDVDLAWRGRRAGWRCLYAPQARVAHVHSGTAGQQSALKSYLLGRNRIWTIIKNYPASSLWRYWPALMMVDLAAIGYGVAILRQSAALRGRLAGWAALPRFLGKRRQLAALCRYAVPLSPIKISRLSGLKSPPTQSS